MRSIVAPWRSTLRAVPPPPLDGLSGCTVAMSMGRKLFSSFNGAFFVESFSRVTTWADQSGNSRSFALNVTGPRVMMACGLPCWEGGSLSGCLISQVGHTLATFFTNSAAYAVVSACPKPSSFTANNANVYDNNAFWIDSAEFMGVFAKSGNTVHCYNWDGNADSASITQSPGVPVVVAYRHDGGNVLIRVNAGTEASAASGNTSTLTGRIQIGQGPNVGNPFDCWFFEFICFNSVPTAERRMSIEMNMMQYNGAPLRF